MSIHSVGILKFFWGFACDGTISWSFGLSFLSFSLMANSLSASSSSLPFSSLGFSILEHSSFAFI